MKLYQHITEGLADPFLIQVQDNIFLIRFESMKVASCERAVSKLLASGAIDAETTLVDSSSGIYAYALAVTCHRYGLHCHIFASTAVDDAMLYQLRMLGATVEQVPFSQSLKYDQSLRVEMVKRYLADHPRAYWMRQYHDPIHYQGYVPIGKEAARLVSAQRPDTPINLVCAVGSGASTAGLHQGVSQIAPDAAVTGIQPFGSVTFSSDHIADPDILVAGIGSAIYFGNVPYSLYSEIHWVSAEIAQVGTRGLLRDTAVFAGLSSGACYYVTQYLAGQRPEETFLFPSPDLGQRYAPHLLQENPTVLPTQPTRVTSTADIRMPWSVMDWSGRPCPVGLRPASAFTYTDMGL